MKKFIKRTVSIRGNAGRDNRHIRLYTGDQNEPGKTSSAESGNVAE